MPDALAADQNPDKFDVVEQDDSKDAQLLRQIYQEEQDGQEETFFADEGWYEDEVDSADSQTTKESPAAHFDAKRDYQKITDFLSSYNISGAATV